MSSDVVLKSGSQVRLFGQITVEGVKTLFLNDGAIRAGYIAFYMLLGIFPFIVFLTHASGLFLGPEFSEGIVSTLLSFAPTYLKTALLPVVDDVLQNSRVDIMSIAFIVSIWFPSKAIDGIRGGYARAYKTTSNRNWLQGRAISVVCVVVSVASVIILSVLVVLGPKVMNLVLDLLHIRAPVFTSFRYLAGFSAFVIYLWFLNWALAGKTFRPNQSIWTGVIVSAVLWVAMAIGFGVYLTHSTDYQIYYGTLAGIAVTMLFFYYSALIVLLSAEINAALDQSAVSQVG